MMFVESAVAQSFIAHSMVLGLKVILVGFLTAFYRFKNKVFSNQEDTFFKKGSVVKYDDVDVERVRRAHLNDLENIPVFWIVGACYLTTNPCVTLSLWLFRIYTSCRLLHTLVYAIYPLPQPARAIVFEISNFICIYMAVKVLVYYFLSL